MHWLIWVVGGLVGLWLIGKFILVPGFMSWGKNYLGEAYDKASPEKRAKLMQEVNKQARSTKDPDEEKALRLFQDIDKWHSGYASLSATERLAI